MPCLSFLSFPCRRGVSAPEAALLRWLSVACAWKAASAVQWETLLTLETAKASVGSEKTQARQEAAREGKGGSGRGRERGREERRGQERRSSRRRHPKRGCASSPSGRSCSLQACYSAREHTPFARSHSAGPCWEEGGTCDRGASVQGGEVLNMHRCVDRSSSVSGACTSIGEAVTASAAAVVFTWSGDSTTEQRGRAAGEHHARQYDP